jgi:hypothetical protein
MAQGKTCNNCYNNIRGSASRFTMDHCMEAKTEENPGGQTTEACYQNNGKDCPCWHEQMKTNWRR